MADEEVEGDPPVRRPPRRSPTTGHRKRRHPEVKRSLSSPREKERLTSSDEDFIDKCNEILEQAKLIKRKGVNKVDDLEQEEQNSEDSKLEDVPKQSWLKSLFTKKEKLEEPAKDETKKEVIAVPKVPSEPIDWREFKRDVKLEYVKFKIEFRDEVERLKKLRNRCISDLLIALIICGLGAFVFKFIEGAFESYYKCGVKRVKRDFIDELWRGSHFLREDEWKSKARRKLMEFENQLQDAFEAGMNSYSGQRSWSFINSFLYSLTVLTTIGYGHIAPVTTTGRAVTIVYAIIGIPLFLILLADFGKMLTRGIKFVWAFVRRVYYTGSCRKVRKAAPMQEMMKGVQIINDLAHLRRPSQTDTAHHHSAPPTPAPSAFAVDDEFNLPITVAIVILLLYIFLGAGVFWIWESDWTFFESFYFIFISMSTIGFGDLVPQNQMYMMASIVYLVFGLALTSMCINVVQEKLSVTFRQASAKIGATIGLKVEDEDGTGSPVSPTHVQVAEVHKKPEPNPKSKKK
ncbi:potassium channel subfamily K member 1 isoform X1 [Halyomorpha halys]|uniref:potassium channel subfamily K member 1 isoform X1 n=1 Tax=Halyomorpha halys TaxID=286706 RepID=UPI0006D4DD3C|nr:TWiK family of potassium channels protein 7 [Halyomorpha halys]